MGLIIRIVELGSDYEQVKDPRLGANGSVEAFALTDPLASEIVRFVDTGQVEDAYLRDELTKIKKWQETLVDRRPLHFRYRTLSLPLADVSPEVRRLLAAQYLRMRQEGAKLDQFEGFEATADYEINWHPA